MICHEEGWEKLNCLPPERNLAKAPGPGASPGRQRKPGHPPPSFPLGIISLIFLLLTLFPLTPAGASCFSSLEKTDFASHNRSPRDLVFGEGFIAAADAWGLTVYDLSSGSPVVAGQYYVLDGADAIALSDHLVFLTSQNSNHYWNSVLRIIDISDIHDPRSLSFLSLNGGGNDLFLAGDLLWVASSAGGVEVVDVSDPTSPQLGVFTGTAGSGEGLAMAADILLVADGLGGLSLIDVGNPPVPNPALLSSIQTPGFAAAVDVSGTVAWVADSERGVTAVDISDPRNPRLMTILSTPGTAADILVVSDRAFVADEGGGIQVLDISNPAAPVIVHSLKVSGSAVGLADSGILMAVAGADVEGRPGSIEIFDIGHREKPGQVSVHDVSGSGEAIVIDSSHAWVADGNAGLAVFDVANGWEPLLLGILPLDGHAETVAISGTRLGVGTRKSISIIDASDPAAPALLGSLAVEDTRDLSIVGDMLYAASGHALLTIDISDPGMPVIVDSLDLSCEAYGVAASPPFLFVTTGEEGLKVIDISTPAAPLIRGVLAWLNPRIRPVVVGRLLFLASGKTLGIVDFSDPANPRLKSSEQLENTISALISHGRRVLAVEPAINRIEWVDISDTSHPVPVDSHWLYGPARAMALDEDTGGIFLVSDALIEGFDIACPTCEGARITAVPDTIQTHGGISDIRVFLYDTFGNPQPNQLLYLYTSLGMLSQWEDDGDGGYSAQLFAGEESGVATVQAEFYLYIPGSSCIVQESAEVRFDCALGTVAPPVVSAMVEGSDIRLQWNPAPRAAAFRVSRNESQIAEVEAPATEFLDSGLLPGSNYCYTVEAVDLCGGTEASAPVCAQTEGFAPGCIDQASVSSLEWRNNTRSSSIILRNDKVLTADTWGLGIWDVGDPTHPRHISHWQAPEPAEDLVCGPGSLVYLADGDSGVFIIDISRPTAPVLRRSLKTSYPVKRVAVSGTTLFVTAEYAGLDFYDISDPGHPQYMLHYERHPGEVVGMAVEGERLYTMGISTGFSIIDVSDPTAPWEISSQMGSSEIRNFDIRNRVAVSGNLLVTRGTREPFFYDISDPANPVYLGSWYPENDSATYATSNLAIDRNRLYLAGSSGLEIIDVSDPTRLFSLGYYPTDNLYLAVAARGDFAFLTEENTSLDVVDVKDVRDPVMIARVDSPTTGNRISIKGDLAVVLKRASWGDESVLSNFDISDPSSPQLITSFTAAGNETDLASSGHFVYVVGGSALRIIDVSNPSVPVIRGAAGTPGEAVGIAVSGTTVYVADYNGGLQIFDVSNPSNPTLIASIGTARWAVSVAVSGNLLGVGEFGGSLEFFDVSNPGAPFLLGTYHAGSRCSSIDLDGDIAVTGYDASSQVEIVDVSDPRNPVQLARYSTDLGGVEDIRIADSRLYLGGHRGFEILDFSNPAFPVFLGSRDSGSSYSHPMGLTPRDDLLYVTDLTASLSVYDVANLKEPVEAGAFRAPGISHQLELSGSFAYIADGEAGLRIVDIADIRHPRFVGALETPGNARDIALSGSLAYLAVDNAGLAIVDISNPTRPVMVGTYDTGGAYQADRAVSVEGNLVYLVSNSIGLQVVDAADPTAPQLIGTYSYYPTWHGYDIALFGSMAWYLSADRLILLDISDPTAPTKLGQTYLNSYGESGGLRLSGDLLALWRDAGLHFYDVSDPMAPVPLGSSASRYETSIGDVQLEGSMAFVSLARGYSILAPALRILDLSDPGGPSVISEYENFTGMMGLAMNGELVIGATGRGLEIVTAFCRPPAASFSWVASLLDVEFRNTSVYGVDTVHWDFGDGSFSDEVNPVHSFDVPGVYTVNLNVSNEEGSDSFSLPVEVRAALIFNDGFDSGNFVAWTYASGQ